MMAVATSVDSSESAGDEPRSSDEEEGEGGDWRQRDCWP